MSTYMLVARNKKDNTFDYYSMYSRIDAQNSFAIIEEIQHYLKENYISLDVFLNNLMTNLKDIMLANLNNSEYATKIRRDISYINQAVKFSKASIQDRIVLEMLIFRIIRGY